MTVDSRPTLSMDLPADPVRAFVAQLQQAIDTGNADMFNLQFAEDVLWGSPFGAVAVGYEQIHAIHARMFSSVVPVAGASRYEVEHVRFAAENVAIAYVRRVSTLRHGGSDKASSPGSFDELAIFVLVRRDDQWWLMAAQHVPDRRDVYLTKPV